MYAQGLPTPSVRDASRNVEFFVRVPFEIGRPQACERGNVTVAVASDQSWDMSQNAS